jgi:hypothetical protein
MGLYYWHRESDPHDGIIPFSKFDQLTVYSKDSTLKDIEKKIIRCSKVWPDKYSPEERYVLKRKRDRDGGLYLHGIYQMIDGKLTKVNSNG